MGNDRTDAGSAAPRTNGSMELVPLADRVRSLVALRALAIGVAAVHRAVHPEAWTLPAVRVLGVGAAYAALTWLLAWHLRTDPSRRRLHAFSATLLLDGVGLAVLLTATGGLASPLRYVFLLHVLVVTVAASYRTGVKVVLWHSLVLLVLAEAQAVGVLGAPAADAAAEGPSWFVAALWIAVATTATASWVNERELRRNRFALDALARMAARFEHATDPTQTAATAVEAIAGAFEVQRVALLSLRDGQVALLAGHGPIVPTGVVAPLADVALVDRVAAAREPVLTSGLDVDGEGWLAGILPDARNTSAIPLLAEDRCLGVLVVEHGLRFGSRLERRTLEMLLRFASHTALALANAHLSVRLQDMARRDGLTGLVNRRAFDEALAQELERGARTGSPVGLLLLDIDHFKRLNDEHGHQTGDEVLRVVGRVLAECARTYDVVARYGGEEFVVILPGVDDDDALAAAERLRTAVLDAPTPVPVTISAGAASAPPEAEDSTALIGRADEALYAAKARGRNRVCAARPTTAVATSVAHAVPEAVA